MTLHDHHPGYITWDQFVANRQRLAANRTSGGWPARRPAARACLLQGLLVCGHCGRRLTVRYTGNGGLYPMYQCLWQHREALAPACCRSPPPPWTTGSRPAGRRGDADGDRPRPGRADHAGGATKRSPPSGSDGSSGPATRSTLPSGAMRPSTRPTAWSPPRAALGGGDRGCAPWRPELATFEHQQLKAMTAEQKRRILELATGFPTLWAAPTTSARDRKRLLRLLIRDITVTRGPEPKRLCLNLRWQGGATRLWS